MAHNRLYWGILSRIYSQDYIPPMEEGRYNTHLPYGKYVLYLHQRRYIVLAIYPGQDTPIYSSNDVSDDPDWLWLWL